MIINSKSIEKINQSDLSASSPKNLLRRFGRANDSIELIIHDLNERVVYSDDKFNRYTPYFNPLDNLISSVDINYEQVLKDFGFKSGQYKLTLSFQRKLLVNGWRKPFFISEISPSRTEIRFSSNIFDEDNFIGKVNELTGIVNSSAFVKELNLNFGGGDNILITNAQLSENTGLIKLYNPLPSNIGINSNFRVYEELINPLEITMDLGSPQSTDSSINLKGPNFNIDYTDNYTVPSEFRTYDDILNKGAITSSFNNIQNYLSGSIPVDLKFDNPNTPSGYHFENFIHYSSATERLKNFKYKLELLESYSSSLATLNNISGSVTSSSPTIQNITIFNSKTDKIIQGLDYYERYLYFEKGDYAWPKTTIGKPHTNAKVASAAAVSWFGAPIDKYESAYYGGQMLSASKYDDCNPYYIGKTIPPDIKDNPQNEAYVLFTEMIAQHFDGIWAHIDSITDKYQADSGLNDGISKELVFNALTERGIRAYSQFENSSIYEYFLGDDGKGSFQYAPASGSNENATMISASNAGSIPKGDISKEIWKRLYHNAPYLLKTKGTERGLKALIATYGIPESVLHVKEYGGPLQDKTGFRTFSYQKESRMAAVDATSITNGEIAQHFYMPSTTKTLQVRFLPEKGSVTSYDILTVVDPDPNPSIGPNDFSIGISQSIDTTKLNSGSFAHLVISSGSADDAGVGLVAKNASTLGPIFNGDVWNLSVRLNSGSGAGNTVEAFATNTTFNKNTYVLSCSLDLTGFFVGLDNNANIHIGNTSSTTKKPLLGPFSGSVQEYRAWTEKLTKNTIVTQSLSPFNYNGNTISSSYEALYLRIPMGSNQVLGGGVINNAPNNSFQPLGNGYIGSVLSQTPISIEETHYLPTPDTVGSGMVSDKVRIDNGTFDDNFLDPFISTETSPQDRQPLDYSDLGVFFSPTFEINEDIIYTLGGFRLDDYIGDPTYYTSGSYPALKTIRDIYFKKVDKKYNFQDYIRTIQFFDHTLFKMIKDFTPAKANLKTGLVIEPHYLERTKIPGKNIDYEQKTEHLASYKIISTSSLSNSTSETVHDVVIDVYDYILTGSQVTATENVAQTNKISRKLSLA